MAERTKITVLDQQADAQQLKLLVMEADGQAVASCQIAGWNEEEPSILGVTTDPEHRRRGYATELIHKAIEMARADGKTSLSLTVEKQNQPAINLYRRSGFFTDLEDPIQLWMSIPLCRQEESLRDSLNP